MSTTITYKGNTLTTAENQTRVMKTAGKYMEDDVTLVDITPVPVLQSKTVTIIPTTSSQSQTVTPDSGNDGLSQVTINTNAVPTGSEGTPIATKGSVSNHSVIITPSVVNSQGYIHGGTRTGNPVTISASELVSGSQTITQNGTVDVTNLAEVVVDIDTSPKYTATISGTGNGTYTNVEHDNVIYYADGESFEFAEGDTISINAGGMRAGGSIVIDGVTVAQDNFNAVLYNYTAPASDIAISLYYSSTGSVTVETQSPTSVTVEPLSVTANGTYTAPSGTAYSPVTVNVPTGGASNFVTGTFIGTSTGTAMDVSIPYLGNGYPIAIDICVSEGANNTSGTFYNTIQRYAIPWWAGRKENNDTPNYYVGTNSRNCFSCTCRYKSSDTDATLTGGTTYLAKATLVNRNATSDRSLCVQMKSATVMSVYIAYTSYGFMANIEYTYHIIYSE